MKDRALTRGRLHRDALAVAAGLQHIHGLDPNVTQSLPATATCAAPTVAPVVLIQLPNSLQFATVVLGTLAAGLTATLASPSLTSGEIAWILRNARPQVIVTEKACLPAMQEALASQEDKAFFAKTPVYTVDVAGDLYPAADGKQSGNDWKALLGSADKSVTKPANPDPKNRMAIILWSSGTSGRSKGVLLSHQAINFSIASLWHDADFFLGQRQRWLAFVPFFHVFGMLNLFMLAIPTGSTTYIMTAFKPDVFLNGVKRRAITYLHMAPPVAVILAKSPLVDGLAKRDAQGRNGFSSVVGGVTGGAPLGHDVVRQIWQRLGFRVRLGYGLTEATSVTLQHGLKEGEMEAQGGGTGRPHWGVELMIAGDSSDGEKAVAAKSGDAGEVLIKSPGLLSAYLPTSGHGASSDMSITTEALTKDGWFRTGDVGIIRPDGSLAITDRIKELIKVQAYQVAPAELEAVLCSSAEVADAGVVGIFDSGAATEWPRAFVVPAGGEKSEDELRALGDRLRVLVEERTAKYKWLKGGVVFVPQIPKSPSGKILRRIMKQGVSGGFEVNVYANKLKAKL